MTIAALIGAHLLALAILGVGLRDAIRRRRLYAFVFFGLVAYQLLTLPSIVPLLDEFGADVLSVAELLVVLEASVLVLALALFERVAGERLSQATSDPVLRANKEWRVYLFGILVCFVAVSLIIGRRGQSIAATWEDIRFEATRWDALASLLQFLVIPSAYIALRSGRRVLAVVLLVWALALFVVLGSRAALLTLPAIVAIDLYRTKLNRRNARIAMVAVVIAVISLHVGGRIVRGLGLGGMYELVTGNLNTFDKVAEAFADVDLTGGEAEIDRYYMVVVRDAPLPDVQPLSSPTRWLMMYLPRDIAPALKPEDVTYALWRHAANEGVLDAYTSLSVMLDMLRSGDSGSIHPTLWGEIWLNGGVIAIPVFCLLLAAWLVLVDRLLNAVSPPLFVLAAPAITVGYLMVARGNSVIGLGYAAYLLPAAACLVSIGRAIDHSLRTGRPGSGTRQPTPGLADEGPSPRS
jgi:hypothetical protein